MAVTKYQDFNLVARRAYNALSLDYNGDPIPKYYEEEFANDNGAHSRMIVYTNQPEATEVGFNASEQLTGYIQIGIFLPTTDKGLNYALNDLAGQVDLGFPRSNFVSGNLKVEWLNVERAQPIRISGHYSITMRVNYRSFSC